MAGLKNVYFIIGTSYAGKSTTVKNLAKRHNGIALEENYHDAKKECEIIELQMLEELLAKPEVRDTKIFVDTNICVDTLHRITDEHHVLVMMAPPEDGINRFFDRPDAEKQFLYQLMLEEPDPQAALDNYREMLTQLHSKESYDELLNAGFPVIWRDENRTFGQTMDLADKAFLLA